MIVEAGEGRENMYASGPLARGRRWTSVRSVGRNPVETDGKRATAKPPMWRLADVTSQMNGKYTWQGRTGRGKNKQYGGKNKGTPDNASHNTPEIIVAKETVGMGKWTTCTER